VVRHHVNEKAHAARAKFSRKLDELLFAAEFGVDLRVVYDVVAVGAPGPRAQDGRGVAVGYTEPLEVVREFARAREGEAFVELKPVCRAGYTRLHGRLVLRTHTRA
jgi:hypothetical protein